MGICASCRSRVEDGAVRCGSCGAKLFLPGAFLQVVGWVVVAISLIPLSIGEVATFEQDYIPLGVGLSTLAVGIAIVVTARVRNKTASNPVIETRVEEKSVAGPA